MIKDRTFMDIARLIAKESKAKKRQVGAIIVKNNSIIAVGYNGTPSGHDNTCEDEEEYMGRDYKAHTKLVTRPEVLHAESNAITKCARSNSSSEGATIYTTTSPCLECAKLIIQSGIVEVIYEDEYGKPEGVELLKLDKIIVRKLRQ